MKAHFSPDDDSLLAGQLAALAHPARLKIVRWVAAHQNCQCKDVVAQLPLAQSTVSQHLKVLSDVGLVKAHHQRPISTYRVDLERLRALHAAMGNLAQQCCAQDNCGADKLNISNKGPDIV